MGKRIISQRRGKGTPRYRAKSHKGKGRIQYPSLSRYPETIGGQVLEITSDSTKSAPVGKVLLEDFSEILTIVPEGIREGKWIEIGENASLQKGNVLPLGKIPEGTQVYNVELEPGDGGKLVRAGGTFAQVISHEDNLTFLLLPSKKALPVKNKCRATIGRIAGAGRVEKPFTKAGSAFHKHKAKGKLYPKTSGVSMNAVDHPFGGGSHTGKSTTVGRNAPPGRKVGKIAAKRTGKKKKK